MMVDDYYLRDDMWNGYVTCRCMYIKSIGRRLSMHGMLGRLYIFTFGAYNVVHCLRVSLIRVVV
jgi:hypothetical protein